MSNEELKQLSTRPVWIEWLDSKSTLGWNYPEDITTGRLECITLGFLVGEDDTAVQVAASVSATDNADNVITIPRCAITKLQEVEWVR